MRLVKALLFPYFKRFWLMFLSIILVGAFGCGILIGLRNSYHSLEAGVQLLLNECGYPDLFVQTIGNIDRSYLSYVQNDYYEYMGIEEYEYRATYTTTFDYNNISYSTRLIGYEDTSILGQHVIEGELSVNSVRMEYYFAQANGFKVGDTISAKLADGTQYNLVINALIISPEASIVKADPYSMASSRDFAYIYVPQNIIEEHSSVAYFNEILYIYKDGEEKTLDETVDALKAYVEQKTGSEITEEMIKALRQNVSFATTYKNSEQIKFYHDALKGINLITLGAPAVFFVVVLIVSALFLFQIVKQCRKDIGIMRALGERTTSISSVYLSLSVVIGALAWIVGLGIGSLFTFIANKAYGSALKLFPLSFELFPGAIFISLGIVVTVVFLTALLASIHLTKVKPVEAMKALPPTNNNTPLLTRTVFKKAPIPLKVTVSQTLRNIFRYIFSGICLLASGMLIFVALSLGQSKSTMMSQLFETRLNYDVQVYFDNLPTDSEIDVMFPESDKNITSKTLIKYLPSEMINKRNDKKDTGLINGIKVDQDLIRIVDNYQVTIPVPEHGIILSTYHAYLLDAVVGDVITCNDVDLTVTAISNEYLYQVSYTNFDDYTPSNARGSLLAKVNNLNTFFETYKDDEHVTYIAYTNVIHGEFDDRLAAFSISSVILTIMAVVVGFMIVFNMMQTNLKEQKRTFATMRTLGYQRKDISMANLFMSLIQFILSMVIAIPVGIALTKVLLKSISVPDQIYPFPNTWIPYVFATLIVLAFLLLSHFLVMNKMKKWNLPESVKERE